MSLYVIEHSVGDLTGNSEQGFSCFGREHGHFWKRLPHNQLRCRPVTEWAKISGESAEYVAIQSAGDGKLFDCRHELLRSAILGRPEASWCSPDALESILRSRLPRWPPTRCPVFREIVSGLRTSPCRPRLLTPSRGYLRRERIPPERLQPGQASRCSAQGHSRHQQSSLGENQCPVQEGVSGGGGGSGWLAPDGHGSWPVIVPARQRTLWRRWPGWASRGTKWG